MDYKVTIDQIYKDQRPFRLNGDDLFIVSHGGRTKAAKVSELIYECYRTVFRMLLDAGLVTEEILKKYLSKEEFVKCMTEGYTIDDDGKLVD